MKIRSTALAFAALAAGSAWAEDHFGIAVGADYSTGKYGTSDTTEVWYLPLVARYERGPLLLKLTLPYLRVTGPANVIGTADGAIQVVGGDKTRRTAEGQGDVVASAGYTFYHDRASGVTIDLTGKVKFGTADETRGLGTGKNDYAAQADLYKTLRDATLFVTLGWKKMGDPTGIDFHDPWYASVGASLKLDAATSIGASYDYRQRVLTGNSALSEATAFVSRKLTPTTKLQAYAVKGFSDSSPDWGGGVMLAYTF